MYATEKRPAENYVPCRAFWAIVHTVVSRDAFDINAGFIRWYNIRQSARLQAVRRHLQEPP